MAFSPDGGKVVSGGKDNKVKVWNVIDGSLLWTGTHSGDINSVSYSPDGSKMVSGGEDNKVRVWNVVAVEIAIELSKQHPDIFASKGEYETKSEYDERLNQQKKMIRDYEKTYLDIQKAKKLRQNKK